MTPPRPGRVDGRRRRPGHGGRRGPRPLRLRAAPDPDGPLRGGAGVARRPRRAPGTPRSRSSCRSAASSARSTATSTPCAGSPALGGLAHAPLRGRRRDRLLLPDAARRGPHRPPPLSREPAGGGRAGGHRAGRGLQRDHRGRRSAWSTWPRPPRSTPAGTRRPGACPSTSRPGRCTCTSPGSASRRPAAPSYAGAPPLRDPADVEALWAAIAQGTVATLATDHAPWRLEQKLDPALDATNLRQGVAELQTSLPMLWWAGVRTGRISLRRFVEVTATNPARWPACSPPRARSPVGSDADLVIWDGDREPVGRRRRRAPPRPAGPPTTAGTVTGWPDVVVARGEVVCATARLTDRAVPGRGRLVPPRRRTNRS